MSLLPFGGVPPKKNVAGTGITIVNAGSTSTISATGSGVTGTYFQGGLTNGSSWSTTSTSYVDPTLSGTPNLVTRQTAGMTVTADLSLPAINFTPAISTAVFMITAVVGVNNGTTGFGSNIQMISATGTIIAISPPTANGLDQSDFSMSLTGIFVPNSISPAQVKIQLAAAGGGTSSIMSNANGSVIEWTLVRIV